MVTFAEKIMKPLGILVLTAFAIYLLIWTRPESQAELQPLALARVSTVEVRKMKIRPTRILEKLHSLYARQLCILEFKAGSGPGLGQYY